MGTVSVESNAKINIGLNVLEKLENGYHRLEMIMVPINLYDRLEIKFSGELGELIISSNKKDIPTGKENIIYKIYNEFYKKIGIKKEKIEVNLIKNIPSQAGLGGGSSDGAFFLKELNCYYKNILKEEELLEIGLKIGADIPFFIINKPALVKGIGEKIEVINIIKNFDIILIKPDFGVSTKLAYENVLEQDNMKISNIKKIIKGLKNDNLKLIVDNIENNLQQNMYKKSKDIRDFEKKLKDILDVRFNMSGSGSCYYILARKDKSKNIELKLKKEFPSYFININEII
ncbi:4-(cytidine 5'-diphospho)-2-C-methyl-D-erythritol kinase [Haliovirga abyssi]|uniref:4-diphosphocytidyl-2-C-methyl-D-erythritol kinase n=1 Tax=Haliovirga abyssi TaxID=2996794 RepID=A0AAU9DVS8_9FUSO|nr:4-(cytidine 5'-diphospho)-2-C-methyl-D-erythritol kinase [Haliovirga abyssi]BDU51489.1 4-diphosphocytidyl-2-C-methyl-D-erythritol kinase [Haliovirga abyssi]